MWFGARGVASAGLKTLPVHRRTVPNDGHSRYISNSIALLPVTQIPPVKSKNPDVSCGIAFRVHFTLCAHLRRVHISPISIAAEKAYCRGFQLPRRCRSIPHEQRSIYNSVLRGCGCRYCTCGPDVPWHAARAAQQEQPAGVILTLAFGLIFSGVWTRPVCRLLRLPHFCHRHPYPWSFPPFLHGLSLIHI